MRLDPGGSETLRAEAEELASWYATVPPVPVTVPLAELGVVGLCGPRERVEALARLLVAQAVVLHPPATSPSPPRSRRTGSTTGTG